MPDPEVRASQANVETNGKNSFEELLAKVHQDLEIGYQTSRALVDVMCDVRDELRRLNPLMRDARLILGDLSEHLRHERAKDRNDWLLAAWAAPR